MSVYWLTYGGKLCGPDKTAPTSGSTLFVEEASKTFQQTTKADDFCCIGALMVDKGEFQFIFCHDFHEMHARMGSSNNFITMLTLIIPGIPS